MVSRNPIEDPIVEMVRERLKTRSEVGIRKYGKTLARKDLSLKQWLYHALEEAMDYCLYLQRAIVEIEEKESREPVPPVSVEKQERERRRLGR